MTEVTKSTKFDDIYEDDPRFEFLPSDGGVRNAKLIIKSTLMSDRGFYKCIGTNEFMDRPKSNENEEKAEEADPKNESYSLVRVKDKLAALWPFLGICAEVLVLCTVILIYEKRRNKTELDER